MAESAVVKLRRHLGQLKRERLTWEKDWWDTKELIQPTRGRFLKSLSAHEVNNGTRPTDKRVNCEASRALNILASGMQSGLTSKARQWFQLAHPDPAVNRNQSVRVWYDAVQEVLEGMFRRSNIYSGLLHTYFEMGGFGTGALMIQEHPDKVMFARPFTIGSYYISTNQYLEVDSFFYVEFLTAHQLEQAYGREKLPRQVISALESHRLEDRFEVVNAITADPGALGLPVDDDKPVTSVHFMAQGDNEDDFLRVSGYTSFPVMTPRWDVIDTDVYGVSPTLDVIGDVKMLQRMETETLKGIAKNVTPPMRIPPELERRGLNMQPGALNVVSNMQEHAVAPLVTVNSSVQELQMKINAVVQNIRDGYYNSLFLAILTQDTPQMTAREVAERHEEKLLMLGPVLERIHYELLNPLIQRAFSLAYDAGMIPPPPPGIDLADTEIEYVSILSQAQKAVGVSRLEQSVSFLGNLTAVFPEMRHAVNPRKLYQEYNRMIGVRQDVFTSDEEYEKAVQQEAQAQQAQQAAPMVESYANAAQTMSDVNPANVRELLEGPVGGAAL